MEDGEPAIEEEDVVGELHCCAASTAVGGGSEDWFLMFCADRINEIKYFST